MDEGVLPPVTPVNPYLGGNAWKNEPPSTCLFIYTQFGSLSLELNRVPGVLLEPYLGQGVGEHRDPHCIKSVNVMGGNFTTHLVYFCDTFVKPDYPYNSEDTP